MPEMTQSKGEPPFEWTSPLVSGLLQFLSELFGHADQFFEFVE